MIKSIARKAVLLLSLLTAGQAAAIDYDAYTHRSTSGTSNPSWMSNLPDSRRLSQISMPGTHDTMSFYGGDIVQTQSLPLAEQLRSGIRALDVRCRHYYNSFAIHHGFVYQNANFDDVLINVQQFLAANPRETVVMRVKEEYNAEGNNRSFADTFNSYVARYPNLFWRYNSNNPTLGEIRGKIVVLQNFSAPSQVGIGWGNLNLQDNYSMTTNWDLYRKWTDVKNHLAKASNGDSNTIYANFLSASGGSFPYFVASGKSSNGDSAPLLSTGLTTPLFKSSYPDFPRVACFWGMCTIAFEGTNMLTSERLPGYGRVGIIYADFPGKLLIRRIIERN
jgi:1-phosphatidylinositol phosphodiesterase